MENNIYNLAELMERLERIENNLQTFATSQEKADYNANTIFIHLLRIYVMGNSSQSYSKWCHEISTRINEIYSCRKTKGGKFPDNKYILKCLLESVVLTKPRTLLANVFNNETNYTIQRNLCAQEVPETAITLIKKVMESNDISPDYLEELLAEYK